MHVAEAATVMRITPALETLFPLQSYAGSTTTAGALVAAPWGVHRGGDYLVLGNPNNIRQRIAGSVRMKHLELRSPCVLGSGHGFTVRKTEPVAPN